MWYAEKNQRPDTVTDSARFVDLGLSDPDSGDKNQQAKDAYQALAGSYFGLAEGSASGLQAALRSDGSVSILQHDEKNNFAKAGLYTIYNGRLYVTKYWAGTVKDPTASAAWQAVSITE